MVGGAESISNYFEEKIWKRIPSDHVNRPWVLDQLRRQFDDWYKGMFGHESENPALPFNFSVPDLGRDIDVPR